MNICFFTESYYTGGLDTFILNLINQWPQNEDQLFLVCNSSHGGFELLKERIYRKNTTVIGHHLLMTPDFNEKIEKITGKNKISKALGSTLKYFLFLRYIFQLKKVIEVEKYDELFIINGGYPAGLSCRAASIFWGIFKKKKSLHNFHNFAVKPKSLFKIVEYPIDYLVQKYTSHFVTVSKTCSESMINRSVIWNNANIKYIYNGIAPLQQDLNLNFNFRREFKLPANSQICLILATYEQRKGHQFLLEAFKMVANVMSDAVLVCCGYGTDEDIEIVRKQAFGLGISQKVILTGFRKDAIDILTQSDILVIASESFESFGLTSLEAMKYKIPIVSTNTGGLKEVIKDDEGGFLFNYGDCEGYSSKIIELLGNKQMRLEQGEIGHQRFIDNFTVNKMVTQYSKLVRCE